MIEDVLTALVLALAHDLALESRRRGINRTDYIADAVALIRQNRSQILGLLCL
ncbi:MAG: hypothetical protein IVW54_02825 [Candidatus Binataceae bacterium]|nr:hypothetical protein [Candidatus Binataceae bacterium]